MERILLIDDDDLFLETVGKVLRKHGFDVKTASSGPQAIDCVRESSFDLIITDVRMPEMDGLEALNRIRAHRPEARAIVITGYASEHAPVRAIRLGADDYIMKPFSTEEFLASVRRSVERMKEMKQSSASLAEISRTYTALIEKIVLSVEKEHPFYYAHAERVASIALKVGARLGLTGMPLETLRLAGMLHDLGIIELRESVLRSEGALSPEEHERLRVSPEKARELLRDVEGLRGIVPAVYHLREHWDGSGYPDGLAGPDIPLESRILAPVEAFVSMTSPRPHRAQMSADEAVQEIAERGGSFYDPEVVSVLRSTLLQGGPDDGMTAARRDDRSDALYAMANLYYRSGNFSMASAAIDAIFRIPTGQRSQAAGVKALLLRARLSHKEGKTESAFNEAQDALRTAKKLGDQLLIASSFALLGEIWSESGKTQEGEMALEKAAELFDRWGDRTEHARALMHLCLLQRKAGRTEKLKESLRCALDGIFALGLDSVLIDGIDEYAPMLDEAREMDIHGDEIRRLLIRLDEAKAGAPMGNEGPRLDLRCLGHFSAFLGGRPVEEKLWQTRHAKHLFLYLALMRGRPVPEDRLMDMFWGESPTDKARQNLLTTLTRVRNVFRKNFEDAGPSEYIIKEGNSIRFDTRSPYTLDVEDFEASIDAGKKSFERGDAEKGAVELQRAVKLYGGDLLEGIYEDWCAPFREELREGYISALADLARHFGSKGKMEAAINCAKMILDRDPFNTRGMISLMTGLAAVGKRDLAVRKYHEYAKRMEAEMSLGPDPEVMRAYYGIVDGGQKE